MQIDAIIPRPTKQLGRRKKPKKTEVVVRLPKNIGAIQISNELSLVERKIMNIILWNAILIERDDLFYTEKTLLKDDRKYYKISFTDIEEGLGWERYFNRDSINKMFKNLIETSLKFNILGKQRTDEGRWNVITPLLAGVITKEDRNDLYYAFSGDLKDIIVKPTLYGSLNLEVQKQIDSRYALALWEYLKGEISITGQKEHLTEYVTIEEYKELVAGSESTYEVFKDINRFLVKVPLEELNIKADLKAQVEYKKIGRKVTDLRFKITNKNEVEIVEIGNEVDNGGDCKQTALFDFIADPNSDSSKINTLANIKNTEDDYKKRKINEILIGYKISEKKRREFTERYNLDYLDANIKFIANNKDYENKLNKAPLIIKAIEDNYANFGPEKDKMDKTTKLIWCLKQRANPYDKNNRDFLRNQIRDYKIYKERHDLKNIEPARNLLRDGLRQFKALKQELLDLGIQRMEILKEIGFRTEEELWSNIFVKKEELEILEKEIGV